MSIQIQKFNQFPVPTWKAVSFFDPDLNEISTEEARGIFQAGGELYYTRPIMNGDFARIVFAPTSGADPREHLSLDDIDFQAAELRQRMQQVTRQLRAVRRNFRP
jgi:hypothetical protein